MRLGVHNNLETSKTEIVAGIEFYITQEFNWKLTDDDLGLVKLDHDIEFTPEISSVCLPQAGEELPSGTKCYTTGWGVADRKCKSCCAFVVIGQKPANTCP